MRARLALQRRLGLPLLASAAAAADAVSKHGKAFDHYGDLAQCDGESGHQTRHYQLLLALHRVLKSVWGGAVRREPSDYAAYSDTRPDLSHPTRSLDPERQRRDVEEEEVLGGVGGSAGEPPVHTHGTGVRFRRISA